MENTILVILGVLVLFFLFFIYKKIDQAKGPDDAGAKYAVLLDKFDTLAKSTEDLRANLSFFHEIFVCYAQWIIWIFPHFCSEKKSGKIRKT